MCSSLTGVWRGCSASNASRTACMGSSVRVGSDIAGKREQAPATRPEDEPRGLNILWGLAGLGVPQSVLDSACSDTRAKRLADRVIG